MMVVELERCYVGFDGRADGGEFERGVLGGQESAAEWRLRPR